MPYINKISREQVKTSGAKTPGELNYAITILIRDYVNSSQLSYQTINDVIGALEGAKLEFYRRLVVPYENEKLSSNGDVY